MNKNVAGSYSAMPGTEGNTKVPRSNGGAGSQRSVEIPAEQVAKNTATRQSKVDIGSFIETASIENGLGNIRTSVANALMGIDQHGHGSTAPKNTDQQGLTFFTRPCMNLTYDNIKVRRRLAPLLTNKPDTLPYAVRRLLDPNLLKSSWEDLNGTVQHFGGWDTGAKTLIDRRSPFIAAFSNLLTNITGWPDETLDTYVSTPGVANEVYGLVDHLGNRYNTFDLTANFKNITGDPINAIVTAWLEYAKGVSYGVLNPYPELIARREIDYQSAIYRLVLDSSRRFVQKIAKCGAAIPYAISSGADFNYSSETPFIADNDEISVPFKCFGYMYNDPAIIVDFNKVVCMFNPSMISGKRESVMVEIPIAELPLFKYRGYPLITHDMELKWFVDKESYQNTVAGLHI